MMRSVKNFHSTDGLTPQTFLNDVWSLREPNCGITVQFSLGCCRNTLRSDWPALGMFTLSTLARHHQQVTTDVIQAALELFIAVLLLLSTRIVAEVVLLTAVGYHWDSAINLQRDDECDK
ncbi:hypothetical protein Baya_15955 [Bagarius yarrelli]|uniref:Uncharacterized protein n=1 Tax=Bagarius yarrelli TaxID=175774 RepID=A0A556VUI4_BAGYA|nr:hypothetical protein Baya_15955 [Bagarius yarrelli]